MTFPSYSKNWKQMNLIQRWASVEHSRTTASIIINTCVLYHYLFIIQQRKTLCLLGKEHIFLTLWESLESQNQLSAHCFFFFFCGHVATSYWLAAQFTEPSKPKESKAKQHGPTHARMEMLTLIFQSRWNDLGYFTKFIIDIFERENI